jgi:hypothetical protein
MVYICVDVDVEEIYRSMNPSDKERLCEFFLHDGTLEQYKVFQINGMYEKPEESISETLFKDDLTKLWNSYHRITREEEDIIKKIVDRL